MSMPSSGSSTSRSASTTSSFDGIDATLDQPHFLAPLAREEVDPVDEAHPVASRAHDERVRAGAVGEEADAAQQVPVRDAGRGDDHLARCEILGTEDALVVLDPGLPQLVDL